MNYTRLDRTSDKNMCFIVNILDSVSVEGNIFIPVHVLDYMFGLLLCRRHMICTRLGLLLDDLCQYTFKIACL